MSKATLNQHYNKLLKEGHKGSTIINVQKDLVAQSGKYHLNRLRGAVKGYQTSKNIYAALEKQMAPENIKLALKHVKAYEHNIPGVKNWINKKQKADEEKLDTELIEQTNRHNESTALQNNPYTSYAVFTDINISKTYPSINYETFTNRMK
eukprot:351068_1